MRLFFLPLFLVIMFPPHLMGRQEKKKEIIPEQLKMPLRVAGFFLAVVTIIKYGAELDMPEAPRV
jgi:hypothetical protein